MTRTIRCSCGQAIAADSLTFGASCPSCGRLLDVSAVRQAVGAGALGRALGRADGMVYYRHSGLFGIGGLIGGLAAATAVGAVLAVIYAWAIYHSPLIYINVIMTFLFGMGVAAAGAWVMKAGKVRNMTVAYAVVAAATAIALYVSWAAWVNVVLGQADIEQPGVAALVFAPGRLWELIVGINEVGVWGIGSSETAVSGVFLWVVWLGEAVCVFGAAVVATGWLFARPFCEACRSWCVKHKLGARLQLGPPGDLRSSLEAGDLSHLLSLRTADDDAASWLEPELHRCPSCGQTNTLTIEQVRMVPKGKNKTEKKSEKLVNRLLLDPGQVAGLDRLGQPPESGTGVEQQDLASDPAAALDQLAGASDPERAAGA